MPMADERRNPLKERRAGPQTIAILIFPDVEALDVTGPAEVFATASDLVSQRFGSSTPAYSIVLCAPRKGRVVTSSGVELFAGKSLGDLTQRVDTLIIAGGRGVTPAMRDQHLLGWIRKTARRSRRVCSVCAGAFLLAEAGLLRSRRVTTHWRLCDKLAQAYPDVVVEGDPIFLRDGNVFTSAGVTAGIDLSLALVEADHGREISLAVARELVMFLKRPGGQSQFSVELRAQASREPIREVQSWIAQNLDSELSLEVLARRAAMSPRNFTRVFKRTTGMTPATFVELARVEKARRCLEASSAGVEAIASQCGFGTSESMRRAFIRTIRVPPASYRERFCTSDLSASEQGGNHPAHESRGGM
jgi:transcriptional regulator GlxA family with amidase domain